MIFSLLLLSIHLKAQLPFRLFSSQTMKVFRNNDNDTQFTTCKEEQNASGFDERNIHNFAKNSEIINKITINTHKLNLLQFLQNNSVNVMEKLKQIEFIERQEQQQNYLINNITKGGLFHDWYFVIM